MDPNDPERLDIETAVDMLVRVEARAQKGCEEAGRRGRNRST